MDLMDWVKQKKAGLETKIKKVKGGGFLESVVAGCVCVAAADGKIDSDEKMKMVAFVEQDDALNVFDVEDIMKFYDVYVKPFGFDFKVGKAKAMKAVRRLKGSEDAETLICVCCAIGGADGDFDDDEKAVVKEMCLALDLDPEDYGL